MKDYGFKIKISDLLKNPGQTDKLEFKDKYLQETDFAVENPGINGKVFLQGLSKNEVLVKIQSLKFKINYTCDKCLDKFSKEYELTDLEDVRFVNPEELPIEEKIYDTTFPIDMKNQTIDLSGLIEIIIKNQEPIIKDCGKHLIQEEDNNSEFQENFSKLTISFQDLLKNKKNVKN